ncbi:MAG: aldehyde dehydrogenase family protein [Planctomycetes bacterium]|nr:aldehyde dehydrogenase family protein [Planctomycetota bacterium]
MQPFATELAAARDAQPSWSRLPIGHRLRPVRTLRNLLVERTDDLIAAANADIGRPVVEVLGTELLPSAAALNFIEQEAVRILAPRRIPGRLRPTWLMGTRDAVHHRPWGVVGVIGTWNYPIYLNVGPIAQALVAGNAVLWKPSENAVRTADLLHELFLKAGFPAELVQKLPATREGGPQLAETDVDYIVFTGSDGVGRKLAARLGERLIPSTLELSGCDAMFVLADANLEMATKAAWFGLTLNRGQTCIAVRRIFVQRARCEEFIAAMRKFLATAQPMTLVTPGQQPHAERLIADAVQRGAEVHTMPASQQNMGPTLLVNVPGDAAICREACFAPVTAVIPFDSIDNALSLAAQSPFGLSASIFTANTALAKELAERIAAGSVIINDVLAPTAHPATPFGGRGASGWGVTQGAEGLIAMTTPQVVTVHKGTFRPHLDEATNPDPATADILRGLLRATHARGLREKFRGVLQLIRGVRKKK